MILFSHWKVHKMYQKDDENQHTWSSSVGMNAMALQVAATLMRLQYTVYLTGVFSSIPWNRLLRLSKENKQKSNQWSMLRCNTMYIFNWIKRQTRDQCTTYSCIRREGRSPSRNFTSFSHRLSIKASCFSVSRIKRRETMLFITLSTSAKWR